MILFLLLGCGGGSSGTDGGVSIRLSGSVTDGSGVAQSGLSVTVLESGDSTSTDATGGYLIPTDIAGNKLTLLVSNGAKETQVTVGNLELVEGDEVNVDLILSQSEFTVSIVSVNINEPVSPVVTPTPRPQSTPVIPQSITINGSLKLPDSQPVRGFKVSIVGDNSFDVSDAKGNFTLQTTERNITLSIENTRNKATVKLPEVSSSTRTVNVELAVLIALPSGDEVGTLALVPFEVALKRKPKASR